MRIPRDDENLFGKVCVCTVGRPFIVTGSKDDFDFAPGVKFWIGLGLDGKGTACSATPCVIAESGQEFHDKLVKRFGGKMSYNA